MPAKKDHAGEKRMANNGQMMEIISYRNKEDIDILFEDGMIVKNKRYLDFTKGQVANPNINAASYTKKKLDRTGEQAINKDGMKMTVIKYANAHNIDIQFEDGIVVAEKTYCNFKNGNIRHPASFPNGIVIKEFAYQAGGEWYYVCSHPDWEENRILPVSEIWDKPVFTTERKSKRRMKYGSLLNETSTASNGMKITCIEDNGSKNITVMFEDGKIAKHQRRESFIDGHIRHPDRPKRNGKNSIEKHIGEVWYDKKGRKMTIIEYFSNSNVTVEYEDGTRLYDKEYRMIKKGGDMYKKSRVGEKVRARNGLMMEIIDDSVWNNIKVRFEDGVIVDKITYSIFRDGAVKHPKYNTKTKKMQDECVGMKKKMKNGLTAEITAYRNAKDIDVLFENGMHKTTHYQLFKEKKVGIVRQIGPFKIKHFAYQTEGEWYYVVSEEGKEDRIMSVKEMYGCAE